MKTNKIYIFIALMGVGGAERVCVTLSNELAKRGKEVHLIVLNLEGDINTHLLDKRCIVHSLNVSRTRYAMFPMYRLIKKEKPESILVFGENMAYILNSMRKVGLINCRLIVRLLNNINVSYAKEDKVSKTVERYLKKQRKNLGDMDEIICQCDAMKQMILDTGAVDEDKLHVVYNPVSSYVVNETLALREAKEAGTQKLVFMGRLDPQKNVEHLLRAFAIVHANNPKVSLDIAGEGVLFKELEALCEELHITESVHFLGVRKDVQNIYYKADVAVLSSNYEGMPNFLIEAISCGIPVVAYDCPIGPREIIDNGINGYLVPLHDIEQLADKIQQTLDTKFDEEKIVATARKFEVTNAVDKLLKLL